MSVLHSVSRYSIKDNIKNQIIQNLTKSNCKSRKDPIPPSLVLFAMTLSAPRGGIVSRVISTQNKEIFIEKKGKEFVDI